MWRSISEAGASSFRILILEEGVQGGAGGGFDRAEFANDPQDSATINGDREFCVLGVGRPSALASWRPVIR